MNTKLRPKWKLEDMCQAPKHGMMGKECCGEGMMESHMDEDMLEEHLMCDEDYSCGHGHHQMHHGEAMKSCGAMHHHHHGHEGMKLAHAYVPPQCYTRAFCPQEALMKGTLFPGLWGVYPIPE